VADKKTPPVTNPARIKADNSADDTAEKYGELAERAAERIATRRPPPGRYQLTGPASLRTGLGIIHHENAVALFQKIYAECGAEAVEHICKEVLEAIRAEREEKQADRQPRRKSGPHENTKQLPRDWDEIYPRELWYRRASLETLAKWIAELKKSERTGKTKSGKKTFCFRVKANTGLSRAPRRKTRGGQKQEIQNP
jgi:hypothetical protein